MKKLFLRSSIFLLLLLVLMGVWLVSAPEEQVTNYDTVEESLNGASNRINDVDNDEEFISKKSKRKAFLQKVRKNRKLSKRLKERILKNKGKKIKSIVILKDNKKKLHLLKKHAPRKFKALKKFLFAKLNEEELQQLSEDDSVEMVVQDELVKIPDISAMTEAIKISLGSESVTPAQSVNSQLGTFLSGFSGKDVKVAIIDTGVTNNYGPISSSVILEKDFVDNNIGAIDQHGHGTLMAHLILENSPEAQLYDAKVLNYNGEGYVSDVISAIEFVLNPDGDDSTDDGADVINLALGMPAQPYLGIFNDGEYVLSKAVDNAVDAGAIVIVAAGNGGNTPNSVYIPGDSRKGLTIGSVNSNMDNIASFSSMGPTYDGRSKPDFIAPGTLKAPIFPGLSLCPIIDENTMACSGTSVSTGLVSGIISLLVEKEQGQISAEEAKTILSDYAIPITGDVNKEGAGLLVFSSLPAEKGYRKIVANKHNAIVLHPKTELDGVLDVNITLPSTVNIFSIKQFSLKDETYFDLLESTEPIYELAELLGVSQSVLNVHKNEFTWLLGKNIISGYEDILFTKKKEDNDTIISFTIDADYEPFIVLEVFAQKTGTLPLKLDYKVDDGGLVQNSPIFTQSIEANVVATVTEQDVMSIFDGLINTIPDLATCYVSASSDYQCVYEETQAAMVEAYANAYFLTGNYADDVISLALAHPDYSTCFYSINDFTCNNAYEQSMQILKFAQVYAVTGEKYYLDILLSYANLNENELLNLIAAAAYPGEAQALLLNAYAQAYKVTGLPQHKENIEILFAYPSHCSAFQCENTRKQTAFANGLLTAFTATRNQTYLSYAISYLETDSLCEVGGEIDICCRPISGDYSCTPLLQGDYVKAFAKAYQILSDERYVDILESFVAALDAVSPYDTQYSLDQAHMITGFSYYVSLFDNVDPEMSKVEISPESTVPKTIIKTDKVSTCFVNGELFTRSSRKNHLTFAYPESNTLSISCYDRGENPVSRNYDLKGQISGVYTWTDVFDRSAQLLFDNSQPYGVTYCDASQGIMSGCDEFILAGIAKLYDEVYDTSVFNNGVEKNNVKGEIENIIENNVLPGCLELESTCTLSEKLISLFSLSVAYETFGDVSLLTKFVELEAVEKTDCGLTSSGWDYQCDTLEYQAQAVAAYATMYKATGDNGYLAKSQNFASFIDCKSGNLSEWELIACGQLYSITNNVDIKTSIETSVDVLTNSYVPESLYKDSVLVYALSFVYDLKSEEINTFYETLAQNIMGQCDPLIGCGTDTVYAQTAFASLLTSVEYSLFEMTMVYPAVENVGILEPGFLRIVVETDINAFCTVSNNTIDETVMDSTGEREHTHTLYVQGDSTIYVTCTREDTGTTLSQEFNVIIDTVSPELVLSLVKLNENATYYGVPLFLETEATDNVDSPLDCTVDIENNGLSIFTHSFSYSYVQEIPPSIGAIVVKVSCSDFAGNTVSKTAGVMIPYYSSFTLPVVVAPLTMNASLSDPSVSGTYTDDVSVVTAMKDSFGQTVTMPKLVSFSLFNGTHWVSLGDIFTENGIATVNVSLYNDIDLGNGTYPMKVSFAGDEFYFATETTGQLIIMPEYLDAVVNPFTLEYTDAVNMSILVKDNDNDEVKHQEDDVKEFSLEYNSTTGWHLLAFSSLAQNKVDYAFACPDEMPGDYNVRMSFAGDDYYHPYSVESLMTIIKEKVVIESPTSTVRQAAIVKITLDVTDDEGDILLHDEEVKTVVLEYYNNSLWTELDTAVVSMGKVQFSFDTTDLDIDVYSVRARFAGDERYNGTTVYGDLTIIRPSQLCHTLEDAVSYETIDSGVTCGHAVPGAYKILVVNSTCDPIENVRVNLRKANGAYITHIKTDEFCVADFSQDDRKLYSSYFEIDYNGGTYRTETGSAFVGSLVQTQTYVLELIGSDCEALEGARVNLRKVNGAYVTHKKTDLEGKVSFEVVPEAYMKLEMDFNGGKWLSDGKQGNTKVIVGAERYHAHVENSFGEHVADARVNLRKANNAYVTHKKTDALGQVYFDVLPEAPLKLEIDYNGDKYATDVSTLHGEETIMLNLFGLQALRSSGEPIVNARVNLRKENNAYVRNKKTDENGTAYFNVVPQARMRLELDYNGDSYTTPVSWIYSDWIIQLQTYGFGLTLIDSYGRPIDNARINLRKVNGAYVTHKKTDGNGTVLFDVVPDGALVHEVDYNGAKFKTQPVDIDKDTQNFVQTLRFGVTVTGSGNSPLEGARVNLRKSNNAYVRKNTTDSSGYAGFEVVPGAQMRLEIVHDGETFTTDPITVVENTVLDISFDTPEIVDPVIFGFNVTDSNGNAINGAKVNLLTKYDSLVATKTTDSTGLAYFDVMPESTMKLELVYHGGTFVTESMEVVNDTLVPVSTYYFGVNVTNTESEPIAGARVNLLKANNEFVLHSSTNGAGLAGFEVVPGTEMRLEVTYQGDAYLSSVYTFDEDVEVLVSFNQTTEADTYGLAMKVLDSNGLAIENARVNLRKENNAYISNVKTDSNGVALFDVDTGDVRRLELDYNGDTFVSEAITVNTYTEYTVQTRSLSLEVKDSNDLAVVDARVNLLKSNNAYVTNVKTDSSGVAAFEVVPNAQMKLELDYNGDDYSTNVLTVENNTDVSVQLFSYVMHLTNSFNEAISGARVNLRKANGAYVTHTSTNFEGYASFEVVPGAEMYLELEYQGSSFAANITVVENNTVVPIQLGGAAQGIAMKVTDSYGVAIENARVNLRKANGAYVTNVKTDANGRAFFDVVPGAEMRLELDYNGATYMSETKVVNGYVEIPVQTLVFALELTDSGDNPVVDARVNLQKANGAHVTHKKTEADGMVEFQVVPGAQMMLEVDYNGATYGTAVTTLDSNALVFTKTRAFSLVVTDSSGAALGNARVNLRKSNNAYVTNVKTDSLGVASFEVVPDAQMKLELDYNGAKYSTATTQVSADTQLAVQTKAFALSLTDSANQPLDNVRVNLRKSNNAYVKNKRTESDGIVEFQVVPGAQMKLEVEFNGGKYATEIVTLDANNIEFVQTTTLTVHITEDTVDVPDQKVDLLKENGAYVKNKKTASDGRVVFEVLPAAVHKVKAKRNDVTWMSDGVSGPVEVAHDFEGGV